MRTVLSLLALFATSGLAFGQSEAVPETPTEPPMTMQRMADILLSIDPQATIASGRTIELTLDDIPLIIIADTVADRMRAMVPIRAADGMSNEDLLRVMQANFDTALDARYAVARGRLWATFIHPLSPLEKDQLLSALVQTINLARTYGSGFTGGAQHFGGGDSNGIYRKLFEDLQK